MESVERTPMGRLGRSWGRLRHWFVPESLRADPDEAQKAEVLLVLWTAGMTVALLYGLGSFAAGATLQGSAVLGVFVVGFAVPLAFRVSRSSVFIGNVGCGLWFLVMVLAAYVPDGIGMYAVIASLAVPMIAVLAAGPAWGLLWGTLSCVQVIAFALVRPSPRRPCGLASSRCSARCSTWQRSCS